MLHATLPAASAPIELVEVASDVRSWVHVAVAPDGRTFVNFSRWFGPLPIAVAEVMPGGELRAARRFAEEVLGGGDMTAFDELVADDVWVSTGLKPGAPVTGKDEYKSVIASTLGTALSNGSMTVHEGLPTLDGAVIVRFTAKADHTGKLQGIAPTNRRLVLSETHLMRFRDGRLVENHVGALNPLQGETIYSPVIIPLVVE